MHHDGKNFSRYWNLPFLRASISPANGFSQIHENNNTTHNGELTVKAQKIFFITTILTMAVVFQSAPSSAQLAKVHVTKEKESKSGWLGVSIQTLTPKLAKTMELSVKEGVVITNVIDKSPADSAGFKDDDVIMEFNGKKVDDADELTKLVRETQPGTKVKILVQRQDEKKTLTARIGGEKQERVIVRALPGTGSAPHVQMFRSFAGGSSKHVGLTLSELNDQLAEYFDAPNGGLLVEEVQKKSAAEKAGFKAGDVIIKAGTKLVDEMRDIHRALDKHEDGDTMKVEVIRKGTHKTLDVVIEAGDGDEDHSFEFQMDGAPNAHGYFFDDQAGKAMRNFNFSIPRIEKYYHNDDDEQEIEKDIRIRIEPEMDQLRIEMEKLGDHLRQQKINLHIDADHMRKAAEEMKKQAKEMKLQFKGDKNHFKEAMKSYQMKRTQSI